MAVIGELVVAKLFSKRADWGHGWVLEQDRLTEGIIVDFVVARTEGFIERADELAGCQLFTLWKLKANKSHVDFVAAQLVLCMYKQALKLIRGWKLVCEAEEPAFVASAMTLWLLEFFDSRFDGSRSVSTLGCGVEFLELI